MGEITPERMKEIVAMLLKTESVLDRLKFLSSAGTDIVKRAAGWFEQAEARAVEVGKFNKMFPVSTIETVLVMQQAHDAYVLGLIDAVPVLCRTALEEELTMRYLVANGMVTQVAAGKPFKFLADGTTRADLERLIQWATTEHILTTTTLTLAHDIQEVGNDYAHAYAMRRVAKSMAGTGNLFTNTRALEIYGKTLDLFNQLP